TPGLSKKQALGIADRPSALKEVGEPRNIGTLRVAPLLRLFQLLRVAQQHQILSCWRTRQNVGERHLSRLIDEKNVHRIHEFLPAPQPGSAPQNVDGAAAQTLQRLAV